MEEDSVGLDIFVGGQSVDRKYGTRFQFYDSHHVDFRRTRDSSVFSLA